MAAEDPVLVESSQHGATDLQDDGTLTDFTSGCTDNDTVISIFKPGKSGTDGDSARIEFATNPPTVGDTISIWLASVHQIDDGMEMQAYIDANSVTATAAINIAVPAVGENIFTLTQAFIDELGDAGAGNMAVRVQPKTQEAGDFGIAEVDADLVAGGGATNPKGPFGMPLHGPFGGPV